MKYREEHRIAGILFIQGQYGMIMASPDAFVTLTLTTTTTPLGV